MPQGSEPNTTEYWTQLELCSELAALPLSRHLAKCLPFDEGLTATTEEEEFCGGVPLLAWNGTALAACVGIQHCCSLLCPASRSSSLLPTSHSH